MARLVSGYYKLSFKETLLHKREADSSHYFTNIKRCIEHRKEKLFHIVFFILFEDNLHEVLDK